MYRILSKNPICQSHVLSLEKIKDDTNILKIAFAGAAASLFSWLLFSLLPSSVLREQMAVSYKDFLSQDIAVNRAPGGRTWK